MRSKLPNIISGVQGTVLIWVKLSFRWPIANKGGPHLLALDLHQSLRSRQHYAFNRT
jgi:hypothetical protein